MNVESATSIVRVLLDCIVRYINRFHFKERISRRFGSTATSRHTPSVPVGRQKDNIHLLLGGIALVLSLRLVQFRNVQDSRWPKDSLAGIGVVRCRQDNPMFDSLNRKVLDGCKSSTPGHYRSVVAGSRLSQYGSLVFAFPLFDRLLQLFGFQIKGFDGIGKMIQFNARGRATRKTSSSYWVLLSAWLCEGPPIFESSLEQ